MIVAVIFNIIGMILAAVRLVTPALAIGLMIVSIFAIPLNTLRIRAMRLERVAAVEEAALAELEFLVANLVCEGCAQKISAALKSMPGICEVKAKVSQKHIYVEYEPAKVEKKALQKAVERAGFTAVDV